MEAKGRKDRENENDSSKLNFSRWWDQAISCISIFSLPCSGFCPCCIVELQKFLLDPALAVISPKGTFCHIAIDKAHC